MSIDMYLSEVRSQTNSAVQLANAYSQAIGAISDSCHAFMNAPLSGNTYESAKTYFTTVYPPLVNGVTMVCEALAEAHQKFPNDFESSVDTCDVRESELSAKIAQGGQVLDAQYIALDSLEKPDPALERSIMRTQATIAKLKEKLENLYEFNGSSAGIFSDVESLLSQLNQGISEVGKGSAWNASTGTFELNRMSLSWIQPLNEKWLKRGQPKMDSELNKELKKYTIIKCYDEFNDRVTWSIEHNGKRLDDPKLQAYLKKVGEYLDESDYDILKLSPKEWETRINNQWKHGTEYFNGTDVPWLFQGLGHIQDFVGKRQADGTWDLIINIGYVYAFNKLQSMYKVGAQKVNGPMCFVAGTLILTKNGYKPIECIQEGDKVLAKHEHRNIQTHEKVVQLFVRKTNKLVKIFVGKEKIETTEEHPFYAFNKGWVKAKNLTCNDSVIDSFGNILSIADIQVACLDKFVKVYNFEVENAHTYFVSNLNILVHNICDDALNKWHKGTFDSVEESLKYHFKQHGAEVGATSIEQYVNKADQFTKNLRRAQTKIIDYPTPGVKGYYKNGKYVFIAPDGTIVSFGTQ